MFKMRDSEKRSNSMVEEREEKRLETEDVGGNEIGWNRLKQILILICWGYVYQQISPSLMLNL